MMQVGVSPDQWPLLWHTRFLLRERVSPLLHQ